MGRQAARLCWRRGRAAEVRNEVRSGPLDCQYPSLELSKDQMGNGEEGAMPGAADEMPLGDQGLSWSWGLDFDALMAALNEPAPWNRPAPAAPAPATASAPDADDSESDAASAASAADPASTYAVDPASADPADPAEAEFAELL